MNERMTRGGAAGQRPPDDKTIGPDVADKVTAVDVDRGIRQSLETGMNNQYAMTFVQTDTKGKQHVSAYVKKAGRSLKLNEAAEKKGGLALLRPICVRSSWETPEQIKQMYEMLPDDLKRQFVESRGGDFRVFTAPAGRAIYLFTVLFKSGEKWSGEGIAYPGNVQMTSLHSRLDELAETRAFNRCVGRGLADGFINADQVAGSSSGDDDEDPLVDDAPDLDDDDAVELDGPGSAAGQSTGQRLWQPAGEADPDGSDPFRTSQRGGAGRTAAGGGSGDGTPAGGPPETGTAAGNEGEPFPSGGWASEQRDGADSGQDGGSPEDYTIAELMDMARSRGKYLLGMAQDQFGVDRLANLNADQRLALYVQLNEIPVKGA
jgi:hypothetical protein